MVTMPHEKQYWFPAKRYGWGWGLPSTWQGWVVLVGFLVLLALGSVLFPPDEQMGWYLAYVAIVSVGLVVVAWRKGEPPRWRWGGD
jgi:hypothetical protein